MEIETWTPNKLPGDIWPRTLRREVKFKGAPISPNVHLYTTAYKPDEVTTKREFGAGQKVPFVEAR
jgi:hypothetical protein